LTQDHTGTARGFSVVCAKRASSYNIMVLRGPVNLSHTRDLDRSGGFCIAHWCAEHTDTDDVNKATSVRAKARPQTPRPRPRVARSPVFYGRCRISAPVSRLPEGSRPGDRISRI